MTDAEIIAELPEVLRRIAEDCGLSTALAFAREFGGAEIYIPATVPDDHKLAKALGLKAARRVAEILGQGKIIVPLGPASDGRKRRAEIARMIDNGMSDMQIWSALTPRCHIETIGRIRRKHRKADRRQHDLFAGNAKGR